MLQIINLSNDNLREGTILLKANRKSNDKPAKEKTKKTNATILLRF